jgi:PEGA domain
VRPSDLRSWLALWLSVVGAFAAPAAAQSESEPPEVAQARALFLEGLSEVREAHWGEALAAFERSEALRAHPLTTYNIGACERALGHYTRARRALGRALTETGGGELPPSVVSDARVFLEEIEQLLVRLTVNVEPPSARIAVDGRPLELELPRGAGATLIAGTLAPGRGTTPPASSFVLLADPGVHVITLSSAGYGDVVVNKTYRPGQAVAERWVLSELPATIRISSNEARALVSVNGKDVGIAPIDVIRPAGSYRVEVSKPGFVPYAAEVRVKAGQESALRSTLVPEPPSLLGKWWFWTAAISLAGGVATATYFVTRSEAQPQRPPLDGGTLGWAARIP